MSENEESLHLKFQNPSDSETDTEESLFMDCCDCTMSITNLSTIYSAAVILQPNVPVTTGSPCGLSNFLKISTVLPPGGMASDTGETSKEGINAAQPDFFTLVAFNGGEGIDDCVRLRVVIDCGQGIYDKNFKMEPNNPSTLYHVAEFGVDSEGQPTTCSLVPLNQSFDCRNGDSWIDCIPSCTGIPEGG